MPPLTPQVDVGVVSWNTAELTVSCLRRLLDSDQSVELRLIVRDNASTDGTADAIRAQVPEAEIDSGRRNLGFAAGVNTLLARSTSPWFLLLNSDAWPLPGAIGTLVGAAQKHPEAAAVAPRLENVDGSLEHSTLPFPSLRLAATCAFRWNRLSKQRKDELLLPGGWMHDRPRTVDWAFAAALLLRREAVEDIGGFDERFFMYVEDVEWCWRARNHGWEIRFEPNAVVQHVGNASGHQRFGNRRTREHVRNGYRFYRTEHGVAQTAAWWALNVTDTTVRLTEALRARDRGKIRYATEKVGAHLAAVLPRGRRPAEEARSADDAERSTR